MIETGHRPAPRRRKKTRGLWAGLIVPSAANLLRRGIRSPAASTMVLVFGLLCGTALFNALVSQEGRHPALLFASVTDKETAKKLQKQAEAQRKTAVQPKQIAGGPGFAAPGLPSGFAAPKQAEGFAALEAAAHPDSSPLVRALQDHLARQGYYTGAIDGKAGAKTSAAIKAFESRIGLEPTGEPSEALLRNVQRAKPERRDALNALIEAADEAAPEPDTSLVRAVQAALNKAGLGPLDEDGKFGSATRDAIEAFELKFNLPVTGEPSETLLRRLNRRAIAASE
jgi:peptidoglycan hydrolase-like protein with peptidoglycan-binding domain